MKKLFLSLTLIAVLLTSCIFMSGAVFSDDYFSIDVPDSYDFEGGNNEYSWTDTDNTSTIYVAHEINLDYVEISLLTPSEIKEFDEQVKANMESVDGVTLTEEVTGKIINFCGRSAYNYSVACEIYDIDCIAAGYVFFDGSRQYTIETVAKQGQEYYVAEIASTFTILSDIDETTEPYIEDDDNTDKYTHFVSSDGKVEFDLAPEFIENPDGAVGVLEKVWATEDSPKAGFAFGTQKNESSEDFADVSDIEMDAFLDDYVEESDGAIENATIERYNKNGIKGLKIRGDMIISGIECDQTSYIFSTEDDLYFVYTYEYEDGAAERVEEVLDTLKIEGFDSVDTTVPGDGNYDEIGGSDSDSSAGFAIIGLAFVGFAVFGILLVVIVVIVVIAKKGKKKKNQAANNMNAAQNTSYEYNQVKNDDSFNNMN